MLYMHSRSLMRVECDIQSRLPFTVVSRALMGSFTVRIPSRGFPDSPTSGLRPVGEGVLASVGLGFRH